MNGAVRRAARLTLSPDAEWQAICDEAPGGQRILASFVLPLACIPTISLCLGLLLFEQEKSIDLARIVHRGAVVYFGSLLSIILLAGSLYVLAPLFTARRTWTRVLQVAAYSSAPVMLAGFMLLWPALAFATLPAVIHGFYLIYVGVRHVLGVKEANAAEFVALVIVLLVIASTMLGALGSWLGVL